MRRRQQKLEGDSLSVYGSNDAPERTAQPDGSVVPDHYVVRQLVGACPTPAFVLDRYDRVADCNSAALDLFAQRKAELIEKQLWELVGTDSEAEQVIPPEIVISVEGGELFHAKTRVVTVSSEVSVVFLELPSLSETSYLAREATRIRANAARLGKIGAWELHLPNGYVIWSEETRRIHEVPPDYDPNLENALNFYPPEARAKVRKAVQLAATAGTPFDLVVPHTSASGARKWVRTFGERVLGPNGQYRLSGAFQDITDTRALSTELRVLSERYHLATEAAGVGIWDLNLDTMEVNWDSGMFKLYGRRFRRKPVTVKFFRSCLVPEHRDRNDEVMQVAMSSGSTYQNTFEILLPTGERRTIQAYATILKDHDGRPIRMIGTNWDVTLTSRAEATLRQSEAQLERRVRERTAELQSANRELEAFGYAISHDLRSPLRSITSYAQILEKTHWSQFSPEIQDCLRRISRAVKRMNQQFDVMRNLAKISQVEVRQKSIDLVRIAHRIIADLQGEDPEAKVEFVLPSRAVAYGDTQLAEVVLRNLFGNAWKFTKGLPMRRISLSADCGTDIVTVRVSDNGPGIPELMLERVFEPFERGASTSEVEGTGIGLSLARRAIERQGGRIWAEPSEAGALFVFTLPGSPPAI